MSANITTLSLNKIQDATAPSSTQAQKPSLRSLWQEQATDLIKNAGLAYQKHSANCYKYATIGFLAKSSQIILNLFFIYNKIETSIPLPILIRNTNEILNNNIFKPQLAYIKKNLKSPFLGTLVRTATASLIFRFGLQEALLKRLPKSLLEKQVSKERANKIVDSNVAKAARILITSASIALLCNPTFEKGSPVATVAPSFLYNLGLGILQEYSKNPPLFVASSQIGASCVVGAAAQIFAQIR